MAATEQAQGSNASTELPSKKQRKRNRKRKRLGSGSVEGSIDTPDSTDDLKIAQSSVKNESLSASKVSVSQNKGTTDPRPRHETLGTQPSTPLLPPKATTNGTPKTPFKTPLPVQSAPSSLLRSVVQFNAQPDEDDSSDQDFTPLANRRKNFKMPKIGHSPNRHFTSPRKVANKDELLQKKRDLVEERRKLPIWSGNQTLT